MLKLNYQASAQVNEPFKFCFASETCIPVMSLSEMLAMIYLDSVWEINGGDQPMSVTRDLARSWVSYGCKPTNGYAKQGQVFN